MLKNKKIPVRGVENIPLMKHFQRVILFLLFVLCPISVLSYSGQLDINTATQKELIQVPLIGKGIAQAIISYRKEHSGFTSLDQLLEVSDIGPKTLKRIKPYFFIGKNGSSGDRKHNSQNDILILPDSLYYDALVDYVRQADTSIDMAMFLFKTTESKKNRPKKLLTELINAKKRGVRVRVVFEKSGYEDSINEENQKVSRKLRKHGVTVLFDSKRKTTHTKLIIIDQRYCFVGSHNLTHSALAYNHELSLLIDNRELAGQLIEYIDGIVPN